MNNNHIAFYLPRLGGGGAERTVIHLANGLAKKGYKVDMVLSVVEGPYVSEISPDVNVIELGVRRVVRVIPRLVKYLKKERPAAVISSLTRPNLVMLISQLIAGVHSITVVREDVVFSKRIRNPRGRWLKRLKIRCEPFLVRYLYPRATAIVPVSIGVRNDLKTYIPSKNVNIESIYNPIDITTIQTKADEKVEHPWFLDDKIPIAIAVGRLVTQKDYPMLLNAFAKVRKKRPMRLVILGIGEKEEELRKLIRELEIEKDVFFAGFVNNPYAYMAKSDILILSSAWEGLGNVLIEAMSLGVPVVSTDCESGPAEILENGKYGILVPVGDSSALAEAIIETLENPVQKDILQKRASDFSVDNILERYIQLLCVKNGDDLYRTPVHLHEISINLSNTLIRRFLYELEVDNIEHVYWKNGLKVVDAIGGNKDYDLLVNSNDKKSIEVKLKRFGFVRVNSYPWTKYMGIEDWIGYDQGIGKLVYIHLHYRLFAGKKYVGEYHLPWENYLLEQRVKEERFGVYVLPNELSFIILLTRVALELPYSIIFKKRLRNKDIPKKKLTEISEICEKIDKEKLYIYSQELLGDKNSDIYASILSDCNHISLIELIKLNTVLRNVLNDDRNYSNTYTIIRYFYYYFYHLLRRFTAKIKIPIIRIYGKRFSCRGPIIAIIGPDGAGKTTVCESIHHWFSSELAVKKLYLGRGDIITPAIDVLAKCKWFILGLINKKPLPKINNDKITKEKEEIKNVNSLVRIYLKSLSKFALAVKRYYNIKKSQRWAKRGIIVISDRYPQNKVIGNFDGPSFELQNSRNFIFRSLAYIERKIHKKIEDINPDIVFRMNVSLEVACSRKPDHDRYDIENKIEIMKKLTFPNSKIIDVDAEENLDTVISRVKKYCWESVKKSYYKEFNNKYIAMYLPRLGGGGAERTMLNFDEGFVKSGHKVDLVLSVAEGPNMEHIPDNVRVIELGARRVIFVIPKLIRYLRKERPDALFSSLVRANLVALMARELSGVKTRVIVREAIMSSKRYEHTSGGIIQKLKISAEPMLMRKLYRRAAVVIALSQGVAEDLRNFIGIKNVPIRTVYNPVNLRKINDMSNERIDHQWFHSPDIPVIIAVGRLTKQKDYPTLIKAFAMVREERMVRLMILGDGEERDNIISIIEKMKIEKDVFLAGYVSNPYAYMKRSNIFILSSSYEGLGNVIIEALSLGIPVISTDCKSGPAEILNNGQYGTLVPVGDSKKLAESILYNLDNPPPPDLLIKRSKDFAPDSKVNEMLDLLINDEE